MATNNVRDSRAISLRKQEGNDRCADCHDCDSEHCGFPDPVWVCEDLGIIVCEECKSLHESITRAEFKSILKIDEWSEETWKKMEATNNVKANEMYESDLPLGYQKPTRCFSRVFREQWLIAKYIKRNFISQDATQGRSEKRPNYLIGLKKGYLWKRGRDDSMFQRRWFLVSRDGASLVYYSDANEQSRRGDISLTDVHVSLAPEDKIQHPNGLQLIIDENKNSTRMIYLYADLAKDMVEWYQSICILKYIVARHKRPSLDEREILKNLNHKVKLEGYLMKTGGRGTEAFRRRWFVLHGRNLMYFDKPLDANPIKTITLGSHMTGFSLIMSGEYNPERKGFHFLLKTPKRVFHLVAATDHERQAWYKALFTACNKIPHRGERNQCDPPPIKQEPLPQPPKETRHNAPLPSLPGSTELGIPGNRNRACSLPGNMQTCSSPILFQLETPTTPQGISKPPLPVVPPPVDSNSDTDYLVPTVRDNIPPPVAPRPPHTLLPIDSGNSSGSQTISEQDSSSSSEEYYEFDQEIFPVISTKVDSNGISIKAYGFCLRIPQGAVKIERGTKCFLSITPLSMEYTASLSDEVGINAHGAQVVECRSFNYREPLQKPLQLEIPHCAIISDLQQCQVKLWHRKTFSDERGDWHEVSEDETDLTYQIKQRCLQITTLHMGSYAFLYDGPGIRGKTMQMAVFTRANKGQNTVMAHIYLFNNISSDSVWTCIENKESYEGGLLSDVSTSFSVQRDGSTLSLTIHNLDGLMLPSEQANIVQIDSTDLWQNPYTKCAVEFEIRDVTGKANITVHQNDATGNGGWQEDVVFSVNANENDDMYSLIERNLPAESTTAHPMSNVDCSSSLPGEDPYMYVEFYPMPSRHASERCAAKRQQTLRYHQASIIQRSSPMSRTAPPLRRARRSKGSTASSTESEKSGDGGKDEGNVLPKQLKEDLGVLLDDWAKFGNDWRMLAKYVGLEHLMFRFVISDHPTRAVLNCFEKLNLPLTYLEQAMKDIDRDDAASLIRSCMHTTSETD